jgi:hypothetical protein
MDDSLLVQLIGIHLIVDSSIRLRFDSDFCVLFAVQLFFEVVV